MQRLNELRSTRFTRFSQCLNGQNGGGMGFDECVFPSTVGLKQMLFMFTAPLQIPRSCTSVRELLQGASRGQNLNTPGFSTRQRQRPPLRACQDDNCGCPEAQMYVLSTFIVLKLQCTLNTVATNATRRPPGMIKFTHSSVRFSHDNSNAASHDHRVDQPMAVMRVSIPPLAADLTSCVQESHRCTSELANFSVTCTLARI